MNFLFPASLKQHVLRLLGELVIAVLNVAGVTEVHLILIDVELFYASFFGLARRGGTCLHGYPCPQEPPHQTGPPR